MVSKIFVKGWFIMIPKNDFEEKNVFDELVYDSQNYYDGSDH